MPLDYTALPETLLMPKENAAALTAQLDLPQELEAPVQLGQTVGTVRILSGETQLGEYEVRAAADAEKMDCWHRIRPVVGRFDRLRKLKCTLQRTKARCGKLRGTVCVNRFWMKKQKNTIKIV